MHNRLSLHSSVSRTLMKQSLFQGFAFALIGISGLLYASVFIDLSELQRWGWLLFLFGLGLIAFGMLPYRRLSRLQLNPHELRLIDSDHIGYFFKGNPLLTLPLTSIDKMEFINRKTLYGIAVWLKPPPYPPVVVHQGRKEINRLRKQGRQLAKADLFFPYFTQRAHRDLIEWQTQEDYNPL